MNNYDVYFISALIPEETQAYHVAEKAGISLYRINCNNEIPLPKVLVDFPDLVIGSTNINGDLLLDTPIDIAAYCDFFMDDTNTENISSGYPTLPEAYSRISAEVPAE